MSASLAWVMHYYWNSHLHSETGHWHVTEFIGQLLANFMLMFHGWWEQWYLRFPPALSGSKYLSVSKLIGTE
jgi:hypothetical protein